LQLILLRLFDSSDFVFRFALKIDICYTEECNFARENVFPSMYGWIKVFVDVCVMLVWLIFETAFIGGFDSLFREGFVERNCELESS
jgi:hypothetical protein